MKTKTKTKTKKSYTISIPVKTFWLIFLPLCLFLGAAGSLIGFFWVDRAVMPKIVGVHRDMVPVPDALGVSYEDARNKFFGVGLLTEVRGREFSDEIAEGAVISQFPDPGEQVKKGRKITLTISRGAEAAMIPMVRAVNERQARLDLRRAGFTVGNVKRAFHEGIAVDAVIETFPAGGTVTSRALDIDLVVSRGRRPTHAEVPNVIGESLSEARKKIEDAGLKVGKVTTQNNSSLVPGTVMSQSSSPGSKIPLEASLDIVISAIR